MATGMVPSPEHCEDRRPLTCSLCSDVFTSPKLLPCCHTFCVKCLEDLMSRLGPTSHTFSCPQCHRDVTIPFGGVAAFPNILCPHPEDLGKVRYRPPRPVPRKQNMHLHCVDCQQPLCLKCAVNRHKQRRTEDVTEATNGVSAQLRKDQLRLQKAVSDMTEVVEAEKRQQKALQDKKAALETAILNRHATLVAMADKFRDELLDSLKTECREMASGVTRALEYRQKNLHKLCQLQRQLQQAINSGDESQLVSVAKEMREGRGSPQTLSKLKLLTESERNFVCRPVLSSEVSDDVLMRYVQDFFGTVSKRRMTYADPEVTVVKRFRCGMEPDIEVSFLFPAANDRIWVSYARRGLTKDASIAKFNHEGIQLSEGKTSGRVSWKHTSSGKVIYQTSKAGWVHTYSKSSTGKLFMLENNKSGKANIKRYVVVSEDPEKLNQIVDFRIRVDAHRAFDVDASEQLFVVLEDSLAPDAQRRVRLYRRRNEDAIATYTPQSEAFQPSDVSFYRLGGQEVLLVSDEGNDAIHVVNVQDGAMSFLRYLAPGCPLLVQLTALNTDTQGRLWVACRGGDIITMTPLS